MIMVQLEDSMRQRSDVQISINDLGSQFHSIKLPVQPKIIELGYDKKNLNVKPYLQDLKEKWAITYHCNMVSDYFFGPHFDPIRVGSNLIVKDLADFTRTDLKTLFLGIGNPR
jgi:hypothetical protein